MAARNNKVPLTTEGIREALERSTAPEARRQYVASLSAQVAGFEKKYRLRSEFLREALSSGKLKENLDVVKWALALDSLSRLEHGKEARLERSRQLPARRAKGA